MIEFRDRTQRVIVNGNFEGGDEAEEFSQIWEQLYCMNLEALDWFL